MAYRRTHRVLQRLAARHDAIVAAACAIAAESGMHAVQILPVAARAGIAVGTVYRYFPSKIELLADLIAGVAQRELAAIKRAADTAPGPLSALAGAIVAFAARALQARRLTWAVLAEPVDSPIDALRLAYRKALAGEFETRIRAAVASGHLPEQDAALASAAVLGTLTEVLIGPLARLRAERDSGVPVARPDEAEASARRDAGPTFAEQAPPAAMADDFSARQEIQSLSLLLLRALGVGDARARGLVVQAAWPAQEVS